jgi:glycosyltransferase involved in cell wall biosynthesis
VVFITQEFDPDSVVLATTVRQIDALAQLVDEVVVLAGGIVHEALPSNCRARTFRARTKVGRGLRFVGALARELHGLRKGFVVAHMCSVYAVLAAPLTRPFGIPLLMWYVHWKDHVVVRAAEKVVTRIVSVDEASFPFPTSKLFANGQAIDVAALPCREPSPAPRLRARAIGRYSPAKGLATLVRAVHVAAGKGVDVDLQLAGPLGYEEADSCRAELSALVEELGLRDRVQLGGPVPHEELSSIFRHTDVLINNARGGADKIVYEAAAACLPVIASNPAHDSLLEPEWRFDPEDPESLATCLQRLAALSAPERTEVGHSLREQVIRGHSLESWSRGLLTAAGFSAPT